MTELAKRRFSVPGRVSGALQVVVRYLAIFAVAFLLFGLILWLAGRNPLTAIADMLVFTLGTTTGFSEVIVRMIPVLFTAIAVAVPARVGLINVGGEGQLYIGALCAAAAALAVPNLPPFVLLPLMALAGCLGGAAWAFLPVFLRVRGLANETISTLLLNYVAPAIVSWVVYGPLRARGVASAPQTPDFSAAARLPTFFDTRIHLGLILALLVLAAYWYVMKYTPWGLEMRAVGGNPQAARRNGIAWVRYLVLAMCVGGAIAGLAGMSEIAGIHGRLRPNFSPGFGFVGFLVNWLANSNPAGILVMSFVIAILTSGGDILQLKQGLPYAVLNILLAITLFAVLAKPSLFQRKRR
jgi:simple sugar transport system permease protein